MKTKLYLSSWKGPQQPWESNIPSNPWSSCNPICSSKEWSVRPSSCLRPYSLILTTWPSIASMTISKKLTIMWSSTGRLTSSAWTKTTLSTLSWSFGSPVIKICATNSFAAPSWPSTNALHQEFPCPHWKEHFSYLVPLIKFELVLLYQTSHSKITLTWWVHNPLRACKINMYLLEGLKINNLFQII